VAEKSELERARRVLTALRALPDGALEAALGAAIDDNAELLARVRAALHSPDPESALADALHGITEIGVPALDPQNALAAGHAIAMTGEQLRSSLATLAAGQHELAAIGDAVLADALATDPTLVPLVEDALALLGDDGPFGALRAAIEALGGIGEVFAAIQRGDGQAAALRGIAKLRIDRDTVLAAAPKLAEVPALLARAIEHARVRGDRAATARLAIAYAAMHDDDGAWRDALDHAVEAKLLGEARRAATRIEATAIAGAKLDDVAQIADRIAALARELGESDVELAAVGDQALVLAQLGLAGDSRAAVARAQVIAAGDPKREIRAHLLAGQVNERLGDDAAARIEFRKVTERARSAALEHELGWAALHLGRLEAAAKQMFRAGQDLELAQQIGRATGDPSLLALAIAARIDAAADRGTAEHLLAHEATIAPDIRAELARRLDARWPS
jgi:hypothetical protein